MNTNTDSYMHDFLLDKNKNNHEQSICVECHPGMLINGGTWIKKSDRRKLKTAGIPIYMNGDDILVYPMSHELIIGSTGSGKSQVLYNNYIEFMSNLSEDIRPSFMVLDLKGELYKKHAKKLEKLGYKVVVFNAREPFGSARYNPLRSIYDGYSKAFLIKEELKKMKDKTSEEYNLKKAERYELLNDVDRRISEIAELFILSSDPKNLSWTEGARNCMRAIMYTMLRDSELPYSGINAETYNIDNVCRAAFHTDNDCEDIIKWLHRADDIAVVRGAITGCLDIKAKVTRDGYVSSINSELNKFSSLVISALTSGSDINIGEIAASSEDHAIFVITDERTTATDTLAVMMMNDLINALEQKANLSPDCALKKDFVFFADEFSNCPKLPKMERKISSLRSRKIWLLLAVQSLQQLDEVYGKSVAEIIDDNCDLHCFLGCNNLDSKIRFCNSMGQKQAICSSIGYDAAGVATLNENTQNIPILRISDVDNLELGEFYVRARTCDNLKSYIIPYFMREDVTNDEIGEFAKSYNGFDKNMAKFDISDILEYEDNNGKTSLPNVDIRYHSSLERNISSTTRDVYKENNIGKNIRYKLKQRLEQNNLLKTKFSSLKNTILFPMEIQKIVFSSEEAEESRNRFSFLTLNSDLYKQLDADANVFSKSLAALLIYDKTLLQQHGKEQVSNELKKRKRLALCSGLFEKPVIDAFDLAISCIDDMDNFEYACYCYKTFRDDDIDLF